MTASSSAGTVKTRMPRAANWSDANVEGDLASAVAPGRLNNRAQISSRI
jgi:hypothetical protein